MSLHIIREYRGYDFNQIGDLTIYILWIHEKKMRKSYYKEAIVFSKYTVILILYDLAFISSGKTGERKI